MSCFHYHDGDLYCEGVKILDITQKVKTPFYLYSGSGLIANYERIEAAFAPIPHTICFAMKSNSNLALLKMLAQKGCYADVVSGGELYLALQAGFPPEKIVFAGVGKTDAEIKYAIETGIAVINVESVEELEVINQMARQVEKKVNIAMRVNPDIDIHGHPYISTAKAINKFGIDWELAPAIYEEASKTKPMLNLVGIHNHIGSMIFEMEYYKTAALKLKKLVEKLRQIGVPIEHINIGGGLGVNYEQPLSMVVNGELKPEAPTPKPEALVKTILPILKPLNCQIFFEPGRTIVANIGILVTQVLFVKEIRGKRFICVDTGMHHLIRPSLYNAYHEIVPLQQHQEPFLKADVVGPICESADFLAQERLFPQFVRGEYLAVMTVGAYGYSLASNYNAQPLPAEVLVTNSSFQVIRRRQKYEELLSLIV